MALPVISVTHLGDTDHISRFYDEKRQNPDGSPNPAAFVLRKSDFRINPALEDQRPFVSTNWLELFHSHDRTAQVKKAFRTLRKKLKILPTDHLAVLNVRDAKSECQAQGFSVDVKTTGESFDPSHTGIYGLEHANKDIATLLANNVPHTIYSPT